MRLPLRGAWLLLLLAALPSCATRDSSAPAPGTEYPAAVVAAPSLPVREAVYGESVEGRPLIVRTFGRGPCAVLVLAGIHGSEPAGGPLLERLGEELSRRRPAGRDGCVVLAPETNPDGLAKRTRGNSRRVDLNRNFPAGNFRATRRHGIEPLCEPEARALHDLILDLQPRLVLSFHQPVACIDWDGPGEAVARAMGERCGLPVRRLGGRPGSLGSWVGEALGIPIVTVELPGGAEDLPAGELWARYGPMFDAVPGLW